MLLKKSQRTQSGIAPDFAGEAVACSGIDFYLISDLLFREDLLQVVGFLDGDGLVLLAVQDQHRAQTAREKPHLFRHSAEELDYGLDAGVDGGGREREICSQRESQQPDTIGIDVRLAGDEADCVPQRFHPDWEVADNGLQAADFGCAGAVKIMQHVYGEALLGEKACGVGHRRVAASGAVQSYHGGKAVCVGGRQEAIEANFFAAAFECNSRLSDGEHGEGSICHLVTEQ